MHPHRHLRRALAAALTSVVLTGAAQTRARPTGRTISRR